MSCDCLRGYPGKKKLFLFVLIDFHFPLISNLNFNYPNGSMFDYYIHSQQITFVAMVE